MRALLALLLLLTAALLLLALREGTPKSRALSAGARTPELPEAAPGAHAPASAEPDAPAGGGGGEEAPAGPEPTVRWRVVAGGRPVEGAIVYSDDGGTFTTRADGTFEDPDWTTRTAGAWHPALGYVVLDPGKPVPEGRLELEPGIDLALLVLDAASGAPVEGAQVWLAGGRLAADGRTHRSLPWRVALFRIPVESWFEADPGLPFGDDPALEGEASYHPVLATDGQGAALLRQIPPGRVRVVVRHPRYAPAVLDLPSLEPGAPVAVRLAPGGTIRVVAPGAAEPLCCGLYAWGDEERFLAARPLDASTGGEFPGLPPGAYRLRAASRAWLEQRFPLGFGHDLGGIAAGPVVRVAAGETTVVDLSRAAAARIAGRIAGEDPGRGRHRVYLLGGDHPRDQRASTVPDHRNRFSFEGVPPGSYRLLLVTDGGAWIDAEAEVRPGETEVPVEIVPGDAALEGRAPEARILTLTDPRAAPAPRIGNVSDGIGRVAAALELPAHGRFAVRGLRPGRYRLSCLWSDALARLDVELAPGETRRIELGPERLVACRIEPGGPARARFLVTPPGEEELALRHEGPAFDCRLSPGDYFVSVEAEGFAPVRDRRIRVAEPGAVTIAMDAALAAAIRLRRAGLPAPNVPVELLDAEGNPVGDPLRLRVSGSFVTDADGVARVPALAPGRYAVRTGGAALGSFELLDRDVSVTFQVP